MQFGVSIIGNIKKDIDRDIANFERAQISAVRAASDGMKADWRKQIESVGLGQKLPRTIRSKVYPNKEESAPAGVVFTRAAAIIRSFDKGINISARRKKFLAIPTKFAPQKGVGSGRGNFRAKITPQNFPWHTYGKLEFVPAGNGHPAMLVVKNLRKSISRKTGQVGGYRKASAKYKGAVETIPMFILVPSVRMPNILDVQGLSEKWDKKMMELFDDSLVESGFLDG